MPFGQVEDDEAIPEYHPFLQAAAGAAPAQAAAPAAAPVQVAQPVVSAASQMPVAPPQGSQAMSPQTTPQGQPQPASPPAVMLPAAPPAPPSILDKYHALEGQLQKDSVQQKVAPKWWERLAGGAVGFGAGYRGDVAGGVRAGGAITNRGQIAADEERDGKVAADKSAIDTLLQESKVASSEYENQVRGYDAQRGAANDQFNHTRDTANDKFNQDDRNRTFQRESTNDDFNHKNSDRQYERQVTEFDANNARETNRDKESARHNRADEGIAAQRESREASDDAERKGKGVNATVTPEQWQGLLTARDTAYTKAKTEMDDEMSVAKTPEQKQAVQTKYDGMAAQMQQEWNGRLSTADPTGRYAQKNGGGAPAAAAQSQPAAAPAAAAPVKQPQQASVARPPKPGTKLTDVATAKKYIAAAGGDKAKARQLAKTDGWDF